MSRRGQPNAGKVIPTRHTRIVPQGSAMWQVQTWDARSCTWVDYGGMVHRDHLDHQLNRCLTGGSGGGGR